MCANHKFAKGQANSSERCLTNLAVTMVLHTLHPISIAAEQKIFLRLSDIQFKSKRKLSVGCGLLPEPGF